MLNIDFRDHPDTIEIPLAGQTPPWFLGRKSFALAKEHGVDPDTVLQDVRDAQTTLEAFDRVARLVWAGLLVFDDDLTIDDVADAMSLQDLQRVQQPIAEAFAGLGDDTMEDSAQDATAGKAA